MTRISEAISPTIPDDAARDFTWATEERDQRCDDLAARLGEHGIGVRGEW